MNDALNIAFVPGEEPGDAAWGRCLVEMDGVPYWYDELDDEVAGVEWTWVDLLEQLTLHWDRLRLEEDYPLGLNPMAPHELRNDLRASWLADDATRERRIEEDRIVTVFAARHNLASWLDGVDLPPLHLLRSGACFVLATDQAVFEVPYAATVAALDQLGDKIAAAIVPRSEDSREIGRASCRERV